MQLSFVLVVIVLAAAGTRAQQSLNITACTPPCNLATTPADVVIFIDASTGMGQDNIDLVSTLCKILIYGHWQHLSSFQIKRALTQWQSPFSIGVGSSDGVSRKIASRALMQCLSFSFASDLSIMPSTEQPTAA
jgi:hypothetical protein